MTDKFIKQSIPFAFRRFQQSRRFVQDLSVVPELAGYELEGPGFVYRGGFNFVFVQPDGGFSTVMYNDMPESRDLEDIEHVLYEFLIREGVNFEEEI